MSEDLFKEMDLMDEDMVFGDVSLDGASTLEEQQPYPPSEVSSTNGSAFCRKVQQRRITQESRNKWIGTAAPKLSVTGKLGALWSDAPQLWGSGDSHAKKKGASTINGIDYSGLVLRLKDSWKPPPETILDKKKAAAKVYKTKNTKKVLEISSSTCDEFPGLVTYVDKGPVNDEVFEGILAKPWPLPKELRESGKQWRDAWVSLSQEEKTAMMDSAQSVVSAVKKLLQAEDSLGKIQAVDEQIRSALKKLRKSKAKTTMGTEEYEEDLESTDNANEQNSKGNKECDLLDYSATKVQSIYRRYRSRAVLKELEMTALMEIEATLCQTTDVATFEKRNKKRLKAQARKRAAQKMVVLGEKMRTIDKLAANHLEQKNGNEEEKLNFPPGVEATWLATESECGMLQQSMGAHFITFVNNLWNILNTIRGQLIQKSINYSLSIDDWLTSMSSYGYDDRISKEDLAKYLRKLVPKMPENDVDQVCIFLDQDLNGCIDVAKVNSAVHGCLSDRRLQLCTTAFKHLLSQKSLLLGKEKYRDELELGILSTSRLERLRCLYYQFEPEMVKQRKPEAIHKKYKDNERVNKKIFTQIYKKYVPWLNPPEILWNEALQKQHRSRAERLNARAVFNMYVTFISKAADYGEGEQLPRVARIAVERALDTFRLAIDKISAKEIVMTKADWLTFHAEISASIKDLEVFEHLIQRICGISETQWLRHAEKLSRKNLRKNLRSEIASTSLNPETEADSLKLEQLRKQLDARSYEDYVLKLNNTLRKVRACLLGVCGTDRTLKGLEKSFQNMNSYGNDKKLSCVDFRVALTQYGVILDMEEFELLNQHYDNLGQGFISTSAFIHGVLSSEKKRQAASRKASEMNTRVSHSKIQTKWVKLLRSRMFPEAEKEWKVFYNKADRRPFWHCEVTGERRWEKPAVVADKERISKVFQGTQELASAMLNLQDYQKKAENEVQINADVLAKVTKFAIALCNSELERLPNSFSQAASHITSLWLDGNNLKCIPACVMKMYKLSLLSLRSNRIFQLSKNLEELSRLKVLVLSHNMLKTIPKEIGNLSALVELDLSNNFLVNIPGTSLANLKRLEVLNLDNNRLSALPSEGSSWANMEKLSYLSIIGNGLRSLPDSLCSALGELRLLNLSNNRLTTLPKSLGNLTKLDKLIAKGNALLELPESIGNLFDLTILSLEHNSIGCLPESFGQLARLRLLYLNNNRLSSLPEDFGNLKSLVEFYIQGNEIMKIPPSFSKLSNLRVASLHRNHLEFLPEDMPTSLQVLKLQTNCLQIIPACFGKLEKLNHLDIANNKLKTVPLSFRHLKELEYLRLDDNILEPNLHKVVRTGRFVSTDEENYATLLRKFKDGLMGNDIDGRVDIVLGLPEDVNKTVKPISNIGFQNTQDNKTQNEMKEVTNGARSKTSSAQLLSRCFGRFSEYEESRNDGEISQDGFRKCVQTVGILLTSLEVDRLTARAFHVLDPQDTGIVNYENFISLITNVSPERTFSSRHEKVASAVVRFCATQYIKIAVTAAKKLEKAGEQHQQKEQLKTNLEPKNKTSAAKTQIRDLLGKYSTLDKKSKNLRQRLSNNQSKAKIVETLTMYEDHQKKHKTSFKVENKEFDYDHLSNLNELKDDDAVFNGNDYELEQREREIRSKIRMKLKEMQELRYELKQCDVLVNRYDDETEVKWKIYQESISKKTRKKNGKNDKKDGKNTLKNTPLKQKLEALKKIFHSASRHLPEKGYPVLRKGDMISATGEFFRKFGKGRQGCSPKEWRQKILRTVNEAFSGGSVDSKSGAFVPFDHDEDGYLDLHDFIRFFEHILKRMVEEENVETRDRANSSTHSEIEEEEKEETCTEENYQYSYVFVDTMSAREPIRIAWKQNKNELFNDEALNLSVASLMAKIEFLTAVPRQSQIIIYKKKRLDKNELLAAYKIKNGSTLKLIINNTI